MKGLIISATVLVVSLLVLTLAIDPLHLQPEQIHLAFGNSVDEMVIMWSTSFLDGRSVSTVYYGEDPENLLKKTIGTFVFWSDGNELGLHYTHTVILRDLKPSTTYYYQCESSFKKSDIYSFTTLTPGNDWIPEFLIVGDMGRYETPQAIPSMIRRVQAGGPTAIIHVGDFAYDFDTFAGLEGDNFMNQIQPMAALVPYMTCVGNHENNYNYSHYINRFHMPGNNSNMWFSWNVAGAHFIAYSTETLFYPTEDWKTEDQIAWLDKDLEEANKHRDEQPWIIAYGHRPFYCSNTDHDDCTHPKKGIVREAFEKLFFKHGVDIVLEAHEHSYERLWPVYDSIVTQKNYTNPWAPIHLITGVGGCNEDDGHCINPIKRSHGPWSAFRASGVRKYGYGLLRVHNESHVYFEEILAVENDNVLDSIWIVQENHGPRNLTDE